jgi:hypothetical protein
VFSTSGGASAVLRSRDAVAAATRANVSIYGIDPRGLRAMADDMIEVQDATSLNLGLSSFGNEVQRSQDSLRVLDRTGGFAVVSKKHGHRLRARRGRQQPITCSGTTRPTSGATAGSARSRSRSAGRGSPCARARGMSRRAAGAR